MAVRGKAVILLSGGLDSATCLALACSQGYEAYALTINYNQRHSVELAAAARVAACFQVAKHLVLDLDLRAIGGSSLTSALAVPPGGTVSESGVIPNTYVPARNTIFLALALSWAEVLPAPDIFIGANVVDYSGYPDCRPEFITAFERLANLGTILGSTGAVTFKIHAPLLALTKAEIIKIGVRLGLDYSLTHSCYDPDAEGRACGRCDSCLLRKRGFAQAGVADPTCYGIR